MQGARSSGAAARSPDEADDEADDDEALARCRAGDISGLGALVARYQLSAVRTAYLLVQDQAAAEDIVQDSFLLVFRHATRFRPGSPFAPWFYRIVVNAARQYQRSSRRRREIALDRVGSQRDGQGDGHGEGERTGDHRDGQLHALGTPRVPVASDPLRHAERAEQRGAVVAILRSLTYKQREALVLRYYAGYRDDEIARILGSPPGTIRWRIHAALRAFERAARTSAPWLIEDGTAGTEPAGRAERRNPAALLANAEEGTIR